jgi:isopenicillin-N epimerase
LREAAERLAGFMGARGDDIAFVANATAGCNAVLRSLRLEPGDEILVTTHAYPAIANAARFVAERAGARIVEAAIPYPLADSETAVSAIAARLGPRTRLAVVDHITSPTALVLPVERIAALCKAAGARLLVDGAHGPGQIRLDLPAIGADWYVGNCHKWLMAPKGAAFLWASSEAQVDLHPVAISHGLGKGFIEEFDWVGTVDPTPFLAVPAAIDFHARLGGAALERRNAATAREAARLLAAAFGTETGGAPGLFAAMSCVRLPLTGEASPERARKLRLSLLEEHRCDAVLTAFAGALWLRLSVAAYNELADYEALYAILAPLIRDGA